MGLFLYGVLKNASEKSVDDFKQKRADITGYNKLIKNMVQKLLLNRVRVLYSIRQIIPKYYNRTHIIF